MAGGRTCNICHENESSGRCVQCGKPVCDTCAVTDENGTFCTRTCEANYRNYQGRKKVEPKKGPSMLIPKLLGLVVLAAVVIFVLFKLGIIGKEDVERLKEKGAELKEKGEKMIEEKGK